MHMLSISDRKHFLALVDIELSRMSDKLANPSTSRDDMVHRSAPAMSRLRTRILSSIAQDKSIQSRVIEETNTNADPDSAIAVESGIADRGLPAGGSDAEGRRGEIADRGLPAGGSDAEGRRGEIAPGFTCEDEMIVVLRRIKSLDQEGGEWFPVHVVSCTLAVIQPGQGGSVTSVSESETIRDALDQFRRRADAAGAQGDRVDAQGGWSW